MKVKAGDYASADIITLATRAVYGEGYYVLIKAPDGGFRLYAHRKSRRDAERQFVIARNAHHVCVLADYDGLETLYVLRTSGLQFTTRNTTERVTSRARQNRSDKHG